MAEPGAARYTRQQTAPLTKVIMTEPTEPRAPLSKAERAARDAQRRVDAAKALSEYAQEERHKFKNMERLRAERRAREASTSAGTGKD